MKKIVWILMLLCLCVVLAVAGCDKLTEDAMDITQATTSATETSATTAATTASPTPKATPTPAPQTAVDGEQLVRILSVDGSEMTFRQATIYYGQMAVEMARECGDEHLIEDDGFGGEQISYGYYVYIEPQEKVVAIAATCSIRLIPITSDGLITFNFEAADFCIDGTLAELEARLAMRPFFAKLVIQDDKISLMTEQLLRE